MSNEIKVVQCDLVVDPSDAISERTITQFLADMQEGNRLRVIYWDQVLEAVQLAENRLDRANIPSSYWHGTRVVFNPWCEKSPSVKLGSYIVLVRAARTWHLRTFGRDYVLNNPHSLSSIRLTVQLSAIVTGGSLLHAMLQGAGIDPAVIR